MQSKHQAEDPTPRHRAPDYPDSSPPSIPTLSAWRLLSPGLGRAALGPPSLGPLQVLLRDPALVVLHGRRGRAVRVGAGTTRSGDLLLRGRLGARAGV